MALMECPECGKEISDKAASCPNCGYPIASNNKFVTQVPSSIERSSGPQKKQLVVIALVTAAIVAVAALVVTQTTPRYTGLPEQVALEVGYVSDGDSGPKVKLAISFYPFIDEGSESVIMWDPDGDYIVGHAMLAEPAPRNYYGRAEIIGDVRSCDGVEEIDLENATIID